MIRSRSDNPAIERANVHVHTHTREYLNTRSYGVGFIAAIRLAIFLEATTCGKTLAMLLMMMLSKSCAIVIHIQLDIYA